MPENKNLYCYHCFNKIDPDIIGDYCAECGKKHSVHYSQSEELPAGTYLNNGRYFVGESIGSGGFGITYIGFDTKLEKKILIKETFYNGLFKRNVNNKDNPEPLKVTYGKDFSLERIMQKTKKECKGLSEAEGLNNIVKVYDWFSENNTAYIITEFINGVTLNERVRQKGYYSWEELYKKLKPLMQSLSVLHEKGIIHRDIKPQNIMIKNIKGVGEELVLIDFGLARFTGTGSMASRGISFTPGYSPFEQRAFLKKDGTYTDVYALAATAYFALTGENPSSEMSSVIEENFSEIDILHSRYFVPEQVVAALKEALSSDYRNRCQTINDFIEFIEKEVSQQTTHYIEKIQPESDIHIYSEQRYNTESSEYKTVYAENDLQSENTDETIDVYIDDEEKEEDEEIDVDLDLFYDEEDVKEEDDKYSLFDFESNNNPDDEEFNQDEKVLLNILLNQYSFERENLYEETIKMFSSRLKNYNIKYEEMDEDILKMLSDIVEEQDKKWEESQNAKLDDFEQQDSKYKKIIIGITVLIIIFMINYFNIW